MSRPLGPHEQWLALRGAVLGIPIMFSVALRSPQSRAEAIRVAGIMRRLYVDGVDQLGEVEAEDLMGNTLRYVQNRLVDLFGAAAWEESHSQGAAAEPSSPRPG